MKVASFQMTSDAILYIVRHETWSLFAYIDERDRASFPEII